MKKRKFDPQVVGDTAHDLAADLKTDLANLREDAVRVATDVLAPKARDLADYLAPRVRDAAENVADYVQPRAQDLGRRGVQFASDARDAWQPKITQLASDARDTLQPRIAQFAADTRETLQPHFEDARDRLQPHLEDAASRIAPLVDAGRDKLTHDLLPRLTDALESVASTPQAEDAKDRLLAAKAALAGDLTLGSVAEVISRPKRSAFKTILQVIVASGLIAGVVFAVKRFLAPEDSGWQAHQPSDAYRHEFDDTSEAPDESDDSDQPAFGLIDDEDPADARASIVDEADQSPADKELDSDSYVGDEPGPEFTIKGNNRSMKYHVQGSGSFDITKGDVWFRTEEAAQAAGFTRAQR